MLFNIPKQSLLGFLALCTLPWLGNADSDEHVCYDSQFQTSNATGSISIPGFQPPRASNLLGPLPTGTWTISTAIKDHRNYTANTSHVSQTFWIDTNPFVNISSSDLPYAGCALVLYPDPASTTIVVSGTDENGCQGVFDSTCYNALIAAVNGTGNSTGHHREHGDCSSLLEKNFPTECKGQWSFKRMSSRNAFGHDSYLKGCSTSVSVGNGNATSGSIGAAHSEVTHNLTNFTAYDRFISQATPVILTVWLKNGSGGQTSAWVDTRLACVTANQIQGGSKNAAGVTISGGQMLRLNDLVFYGLLAVVALVSL